MKDLERMYPLVVVTIFAQKLFDGRLVEGQAERLETCWRSATVFLENNRN
jgi:hypothetical protein